MKNPTKIQVSKVIRNLKKFSGESGVEMMEGHISYCGTPMCHGGYYALATLKNPRSYSEGAKQMAKDLGFESDWKLEEWAQNNPEIWGNTLGQAMFCQSIAFKSETRPHGCNTLQDIIDHWTEVKSRL